MDSGYASVAIDGLAGMAVSGGLVEMGRCGCHFVHYFQGIKSHFINLLYNLNQQI